MKCAIPNENPNNSFVRTGGDEWDSDFQPVIDALMTREIVVDIQ